MAKHTALMAYKGAAISCFCISKNQIVKKDQYPVIYSGLLQEIL